MPAVSVCTAPSKPILVSVCCQEATSSYCHASCCFVFKPNEARGKEHWRVLMSKQALTSEE